MFGICSGFRACERFSFVREPPRTALEWEADARIRTGDPFITSEVLYQLSYVGR